jgi:signal peptidase I
MAGDNVASSDDSRYWGLLPDDFIAGKVWKVWNSKDPKTKELRWKRIGKNLQ